MRYSILISIVFFINFLFSQSYYNRILGEELHFNSAKSMAMGENSLADNNSSMLLSNPSILSNYFKEAVYILCHQSNYFTLFTP